MQDRNIDIHVVLTSWQNQKAIWENIFSFIPVSDENLISAIENWSSFQTNQSILIQKNREQLSKENQEARNNTPRMPKKAGEISWQGVSAEISDFNLKTIFLGTPIPKKITVDLLRTRYRTAPIDIATAFNNQLTRITSQINVQLISSPVLSAKEAEETSIQNARKNLENFFEFKNITFGSQELLEAIKQWNRILVSNDRRDQLLLQLAWKFFKGNKKFNKAELEEISKDLLNNFIKRQNEFLNNSLISPDFTKSLKKLLDSPKIIEELEKQSVTEKNDNSSNISSLNSSISSTHSLTTNSSTEITPITTPTLDRNQKTEKATEEPLIQDEKTAFQLFYTIFQLRDDYLRKAKESGICPKNIEEIIKNIEQLHLNLCVNNSNSSNFNNQTLYTSVKNKLMKESPQLYQAMIKKWTQLNFVARLTNDKSLYSILESISSHTPESPNQEQSSPNLSVKEKINSHTLVSADELYGAINDKQLTLNDAKQALSEANETDKDSLFTTTFPHILREATMKLHEKDINNDLFFKAMDGKAIQPLKKERLRISKFSQESIKDERTTAINDTLKIIIEEEEKAKVKMIEKQETTNTKKNYQEKIIDAIDDNLIDNEKLNTHRNWGQLIGKYLLKAVMLVTIIPYGIRLTAEVISGKSFTLFSTKTKSQETATDIRDNVALTL